VALRHPAHDGREDVSDQEREDERQQDRAAEDREEDDEQRESPPREESPRRRVLAEPGVPPRARRDGAAARPTFATRNSFRWGSRGLVGRHPGAGIPEDPPSAASSNPRIVATSTGLTRWWSNP